MKYFVCMLSVFLIFWSCKKTDEIQDEKAATFNWFMELRKEGRTKEAYDLLSVKSRKVFSFEEFDEYCFNYKVMEWSEPQKRDEGYYSVTYKYYDKRFKKDGSELYTFYITENIETVSMDGSGIIFPHTGFIVLRKKIEEKDVEGADFVVEKMISVDSRNPDVLESAKQMGFIPENF
jgi:hypothetical protein